MAAAVLLSPFVAYASQGDDDRILWRFEAQGSYIQHRPAVRADGAILFMDSGGIVYALDPEGGLLWSYSTGGSGSQGPVALGADGTAYVASNPLGPDLNIIALSANGQPLWTLPDQSQEAIAGPAVGPDGNVYVVDDTPGLGAFSLTPAGNLRWNNTDFSDFGTLGTEIAFGTEAGKDQLYFCANGILTATRLDGNERWKISVAPNSKQVAVAPGSGNVYSEAFVTGSGIRLRVYDPKNGNVLWTFFTSPTNSLTAPGVGPDGTVYIVRNLNQLHSIHPSGTPKWNVAAGGVFGPSVASQSPYHGPSVSPDDEVVLLAGQTAIGGSGIVRAFDTDGDVLWTVSLYEGDRPNNRARFNAAGSVAYVAASNDNQAFMYAIRLGDEPGEPLCEAGDLNCDGIVNVFDLLALLAQWGPCMDPRDCDADLDFNGTVNVFDLLILLANWG